MAAVLASVYLAASGAASMHLVLRAHAICLEHGELVHGGHDAGHAGEPAKGAPEAGQGSRHGPAFDAAPEAHRHEHCSLASHRNPNAVESVRAPALSGQVPLAPGCVMFPADGAPLGRAVTSLAPKQSPPAS